MKVKPKRKLKEEKKKKVDLVNLSKTFLLINYEPHSVGGGGERKLVRQIKLKIRKSNRSRFCLDLGPEPLVRGRPFAFQSLRLQLL